MQKIMILKGLPGSGRTIFAKERASSGSWVRISSADIRKNIVCRQRVNSDRIALKMQDEFIKWAISQGKSVVVDDDVNLNPIRQQELENLGKELGVVVEVNDSFLNVNPEDCVKNDLNEKNPVGEKYIWMLYHKWLLPKQDIKFERDDRLRAVICDIDGTLALNRSGRDYYDMSRVVEDAVDPFVCAIVESLYETYGKDYLKVILVSGRKESARKDIEKWLNDNMIPYHELYMRADEDNRPDEDVKREMYKTYIESKYAVLGVLDDRNKIIRKTWQPLGLRVAKLGLLDEEY